MYKREMDWTTWVVLKTVFIMSMYVYLGKDMYRCLQRSEALCPLDFEL